MPDAGLKMTVFCGSGSAATAPKQTGQTIPPTGWTETWWLSSSSFTLGVAIAQAYIPIRAALFGVGAYISAVRVTLPGVQPVALKRQSQIAFPNLGEGGASVFVNQPADDYDPTQADLMFRVEAGPAKRRVFWLGGMPDSQTDSFQLAGVKPAYTNSGGMKKLINFILANFGTRDLVPPRNPVPSLNTYTFNQITDVIPIQARNRKRGRPFYLFRGRRMA